MNRPKVTFLVSNAFEILSYTWNKACAAEYFFLNPKRFRERIRYLFKK